MPLLSCLSVLQVTLLPLGQRQCYTAGANFFARYLNASSCVSADASSLPSNTCLNPPGAPTSARYGVVGDAGVGYSNYNVLVTSSALDRSLLSARSFLAGLFEDVNTPTPSLYLPDGSQVVPVYSSAAFDADDTFIRAYNNCPAYQARLAAWYATSSAFSAMSNATASFRAAVGALPGWGTGVVRDTSLKNWYNVWDEARGGTRRGDASLYVCTVSPPAHLPPLFHSARRAVQHVFVHQRRVR